MSQDFKLFGIDDVTAVVAFAVCGMGDQGVGVDAAGAGAVQDVAVEQVIRVLPLQDVYFWSTYSGFELSGDSMVF